ncbi:meprin A subunit beta-like isoform X2 [Osmerus eperlanus]|uniref:meprin A subunit beta-like isoform X2 n=1 Tax=Osmerus eperlanus TaxID=29151 RepID=UPI002E123277
MSQEHLKMMYFATFLVVSLAVSQTLSLYTLSPKPEPRIKEIEENNDISEINKDLGLTGGDILELNPNQRNAILNTDQLWTSPVPYVLDNSLDMNAKGVILRALDQFRLKTCINFKPRTSELYYITVQKLGGCFSYIGRVIANGQVLSIGNGCDDMSVVEHEFMHALGFYHEQARYDRDDYVRIVWENILKGYERNFAKSTVNDTTNLDTLYDYNSVMHYGKDFFTNGNGSTIITLQSEFQDVIGQRLEMSPNDVLKINRLYSCNKSVAFMEYCSFSEEGMCGVRRCSRIVENNWNRVASAVGGPSSDHTNLGTSMNGTGLFMYSSTASGQEGDSAWLESRRMTPSRLCNVQCLQFYYYHSGNQSDQLNIWIREYQDESDSRGTLRLMGQITGPASNHWQLHHVPLNATKSFQVEFEVRKGAGSSTGGFAIDDINLSETECPHLTWQIRNFENRLTTSSLGTFLYSPRLYSSEGYAYQIVVILSRSYFGTAVRLVSGQHDDQLQWPCPWRQVTFQALDQNPQIQLQMSNRFSLTTDPTETEGVNATFVWDNPRKVGTLYTDENNEQFYGNSLFGRAFFSRLIDMKTQNFLKGGDAIILASFQDISPLLQNNSLPCPTLPPVTFSSQTPQDLDEGTCATRFINTTTLPPTTIKTALPPTTIKTALPPTTIKTTLPPTTIKTALPPTTIETALPPTTTEEDTSIFGFSPGVASSPVLLLLTLLFLLTH